jgi:hypothetical protein
VTAARRWTGRVLFLLALGAAATAFAQSQKAARKSAPGVAGGQPKVEVAVESILDRRTTRDFPRSELQLALKLDGADASAVQSAHARLTKAADDTGRNLIPNAKDVIQGSDRWDEARDGKAPTPRLNLASPSRKAKALSSVEGVVEVFLPSRDPAGTIPIARVASKRDKPLAVPALAAQHIKLAVLSKEGLEKEKKQAEAKKKAAEAKKAKKGDSGLEEMGQAMGDMLAGMFERLFFAAGANDLILKVDDPGKKIFSFDLVGANGKAITNYGTTEIESYRIVRMLEPIPPAATLQVRLKTPRSFGEVPFTLTNVKLP